MWVRAMLLAAALNALCAIGFDAFASHALRGMAEPKALEWIATGARYQFVHAVAMLALAAVQHRQPDRFLAVAFCAWVAGALLFCGSLYAMAFGLRGLGLLTPAGGVAFMLGWLAVLVAALRR